MRKKARLNQLLSLQDSVDKALKKLNEEKNTINCDIDMIRLVMMIIMTVTMMIMNDDYMIMWVMS